MTDKIGLSIDQKAVVYLAAIAVLPSLVGQAGDDEPDEIADIVSTAVEFGLGLVGQVEFHFAPDVEENEVEPDVG